MSLGIDLTSPAVTPTIADATAGRTGWDAVLIPPSLADEIGRVTMTAQVVATLGGTCHFGKDMHTGLIFGRRDPLQTRLHPYGHPMQGRDRYRWWVAERDGRKWVAVMPATGDPCEAGQMLIGELLPDPHAETPETRAAVVQALAAMKAEYVASAEYAELKARIQGPNPAGSIAEHVNVGP